MLQNTRENMKKWLMDPQAAVPGNAMPNMGIKEKEADTLAAYLVRLH